MMDLDAIKTKVNWLKNSLSELKPCPKCGGIVLAVKSNDPPLYRPERNGWHIQCNACDLLFGYDIDYAGEYATEAEAIAAWNRTPPAHKYTLEELVNLDKQPVFIVDGSKPENRYWELAEYGSYYLLERDFHDYDKTCSAYDREPMEEL